MKKLLFIATSILVLAACSSKSEVKDSPTAMTEENLGQRLEETYADYNINDRNNQKELKDLKKKYKFIHFVAETEKSRFYLVTKTALKYGNHQNQILPFNNKDWGMINAAGEKVLETAYQAILNPGNIASGYVEILQNDKYGLYDYVNNILVEPQFDYIVPTGYISFAAVGFRDGNGYKIMDDGSLRKIENQNVFELMSDDRREFNAYDKRIAKWFDLDNDKNEYNDFLSILPSYFSRLKLSTAYSFLSSIQHTEYVDYEFKGELDKLRPNGKKYKSLISRFIDEGADGRSYKMNEYYLNSIDENGKILAVKNISTTYESSMYCENFVLPETFGIRYINDTLIEVKSRNENYEFEHTDRDTLNYTIETKYTYFALQANGSIKALYENYKFPMAQTIRLTEEHLKGIFIVGNVEFTSDDEPAYEARHFLSLYDLEYMKNQILASKGYIFQDVFWKNVFFVKKWYKMLHKDVTSKLNPIEKANIQFLDEWINKLKNNEKSYTKPQKINCGFAG